MQKLLIALIACLLIFSACARKRAEIVVPSGDSVVIDAKNIAPGEAKFFRYDFRGREIRFIAGRTETGSFVTVFDACATCYVNKKGFRAEPGCVVCNDCGSARFKLSEMEKGLGNCVPIALPHRALGDNIIISLGDLQAGWKWF
ncbi:MAG: Fe-S-containing protein [Nitrospirota bacterium]